MTQANDSVIITPGATGATVATHLVNGKEYQVVILSDPAGHLEETEATYLWWVPNAAVGANKLYADIFNATGSGKVMELRALYLIPGTVVAATGAVSIEVNLFRTSAVGTGGVAAVASTTTSTAATHVFAPKDTNNAAIPTQVTARTVPTAGATIASFLMAGYAFPEETSAGAQLQPFYNLLPQVRGQQLTIRENSGLLIKQGGVVSAGTVGFAAEFVLI